MAPKRRAGEDGGQPAKKARGGGRTVDGRVPNAGGMKVVDEYSIKLNQTHIDANNNKFYIIQVLESKGTFHAWNRWGRVGEDGQSKLLKCSSKEHAVKEFGKKFREKTKNQWANRASFKPVNGKYTIVETEDSGKGGGAGAAPMGKLTEQQIIKGRAVLDKLKAVLKKGSAKSQIDTLSSEFYTLIPHDFGRTRPPAIKNDAMLNKELELLKFLLRMGFEKIEAKTSVSPIKGVMSLPVPTTLADACKGICSKGQVHEVDQMAKQLEKKQAGHPKKKMSASLYGAIAMYTGDAIYSDINKCLRDENRGKIKKYMRYLRLFLESMTSLSQQKRTLWRGVAANLCSNPQYAVGKTVTWWGISSTTSSKSVADGFAGGCSGDSTVVTIEAKTACDVSPLSFYGNEKESLLSPGTQFKVKSNTKGKNGVGQITLVEVGRAIA